LQIAPKKNPNVFYEIAIAHALGKDFIQITKDINDIPIDLKQNGILINSNDKIGLEKLEEELKLTIYDIIHDNPSL